MYLDQIMQFSMGTLFEKSMLCILVWFGIVHCDICDYNQWIKQECSIVFESVWVGGGHTQPKPSDKSITCACNLNFQFYCFLPFDCLHAHQKVGGGGQLLVNSLFNIVNLRNMFAARGRGQPPIPRCYVPVKPYEKKIIYRGSGDTLFHNHANKV